MVTKLALLLALPAAVAGVHGSVVAVAAAAVLAGVAAVGLSLRGAARPPIVVPLVDRPSATHDCVERLRDLWPLARCVGRVDRWCLAAAVVFGAAPFWIASRWLFPDEPLSATVMYRSLEAMHIPLIASLTRPTLGETGILEHWGEGLRTFPIGSTLWHGIAFGVVGAAAFPLLDALAYVAYVFLARATLRIAGCSAQAASLAATALALDAHSTVWRILGGMFPCFWGHRIPRPFVTELYLVACVALMLAMVRFPRLRARASAWAALGVCASLLLQGEIYLAFPVSLTIAALAVWRAWRGDANERRATVVGAVCGALAWLAASALFIAQRLGEPVDAPRRLGVFPLRVWDLPAPWRFYDRNAPIPATAFVVATIAAALALAWRWRRDVTAPWRSAACAGAALLVATSYAAPWLSVALLGKAIQLYHFEDALSRIDGYALLVIGALAGRAALRRFAMRAGDPLARRRRLRAIALALVAFSMLPRVGKDVREEVVAAKRCDISSEPTRNAAAGPAYRGDFAALARELSGPRYEAARVVATFDTQVAGWWQGFHRGGCVLNPDPAFASISDAEIERRLAKACRLVGVPEDRFAAFVTEPYMDLYFLGSDKYQASAAYRFAPLADYDPAELAAVAHRRWVDSWAIAVPRSERRRLDALYRRIDGDDVDARVDVVVMTRFEPYAPDPARFSQTWSNGTFRVYLPVGGALAAR